MRDNTLRSIDLYLDHPPGEVVQTEEVKDVGAGMYPCYYVDSGDKMLVSTSVTELIAELGNLEENPEFSPPEFLRRCLLDPVEDAVPKSIFRLIPHVVQSSMRDKDLFSTNDTYYADPTTIDQRVSILGAFERVTPEGKESTFNPTYSLSDPDKFIEKQIRHLTEFVHSVEEDYPEYEHLIRVGGKDSQLICLLPKRTDSWHVFSSQPNYPLVKEFLEKNNIQIGQLFRHDNENEETMADYKRKVVCSDLRTNPRHNRWAPTIESIKEDLGGKVIQWGGQLGDTINSYNPSYHGTDDYFSKHINRAANWQSVSQQIWKNFAGTPCLSPYHSEKVWEDLYQHYDPGMMSPEDDFRSEIGKQVHGGEVWWPNNNPGPSPYEYDEDWPNPETVYREYISERLAGEKSCIKYSTVDTGK